MPLDLSDEEKRALAKLLRRAIDDDRYPLSPRVQMWQAILDRIEPPPVREPVPLPKVYKPPRAGPPSPMRTQPGSAMTLGNAAAHRVRIIVCCRGCGHRLSLIRHKMGTRSGCRDVRARLARAARMLPVRQPGCRYGADRDAAVSRA